MRQDNYRKESPTLDFIAGGGEMGRLIREMDWSETPLGPTHSWPQSLRTCIRIMLTSRQPIWIGWGKELIKFYNDPYRAILGGKHPSALGRPAVVVWKDIWKDIEPLLSKVMENNEGTFVESQLLIMERNGYPEETYYTFSYTPIAGDDGKTAGMFCANSDDTDKIISERQLKTLTLLGTHLRACNNKKDLIEKVIETLQQNPHDFPFALFKTVSNGRAILVHSTPLGIAETIVPKELDLSSHDAMPIAIKSALESGDLQLVHGLPSIIGEMPKGAWPVSPNKAIVLPIMQAAAKDPHGIMILGVNPYRLPDKKYYDFVSLVGDTIASSFNDVHHLEEERKRAEALAEIDKAKTTFFSNISHEFRTPLTLLLGPIEEVARDPATTAQNRMRADMAYRNALRMQKLVNTLLEFSRIEAGRMVGKFHRVDICNFTQELASTFRSAVEKAGMELRLHCTDIQSEVYVDPEMWEKIILNLVSNAFKYTTQGFIDIRIHETNGHIDVAVSDTGTGIAGDQLEKIFDRFHRIDNIQGRSQEGSGIGLPMVRELVKLHKGTITVTSDPGKGSTFTVRIPTGRLHLPADKIVTSTGDYLTRNADAFVEEAVRWLPIEQEQAITPVTNAHSVDAFQYKPSGDKKYTVVVADDNADMREYIERLLSSNFRVITAVDGEDAFRKALKYNPDLLLSDIMMPKLDGFGLLRKIQNHPDRKNLPVIFLSARAGEEAKVEGLAAGADDYLVKPFPARELLAKVEGHIKISKSRIAAANNVKNVISQTPVATTLLRGPSFVIEMVNKRGLELWGRSYDEVINQPIADALPEIAAQGFSELLTQVYTTGIPIQGNETAVELIRFGKPCLLYLNFIYQPLLNEEEEIVGIIAIAVEVTDQVVARKKLEQSEKELNELANAVPQLVWVANAAGDVIYYNDRIKEFSGARKMDTNTWSWDGLVHEDDCEATQKAWMSAAKTGLPYQAEHRVKMKDGTYRWHLSRGVPFKDEYGNILKWFGSATDIHAAKEQSTILTQEVEKRTAQLNQLNTFLQRSNNELQQFAHVASHDLREPVRKIKTYISRFAEDKDNLFSARSQTYLKKIDGASDRIFTMIEGVLKYSVLNTSEQEIEWVSLQTIFENIENDLELLIAEKKARLLYAGLPAIPGSSVLLYQLFYNLVNNSLKFSWADKPPVIQVSATITGERGAENAVVEVVDNGIGFEAHHASKIFESFARLNSKDKFEGTGLGLSLCKRIAERHGGSIEAHAKLNEGARFVVRLPMQQRTAQI